MNSLNRGELSLAFENVLVGVLVKSCDGFGASAMCTSHSGLFARKSDRAEGEMLEQPVTSTYLSLGNAASATKPASVMLEHRAAPTSVRDAPRLARILSPRSETALELKSRCAR
eukprot:scaffold228967_cov27-Tisochrysis_lutea.AAC.2